MPILNYIILGIVILVCLAILLIATFIIGYINGVRAAIDDLDYKIKIAKMSRDYDERD